MTDPNLLRRAIESVGIEKPSDYTLVMEEVERLMEAEEKQNRFDGWSLKDFADQCRMQARDNLDPEYSEFMTSLAERLTGCAALIRAATDLVKEAEEMGFGKTSDMKLPGAWDAMVKALEEVKK